VAMVSCVMPTANRKRWVLQAIHYFQRQTYTNAELVIVDDGTDGTAEFIAERIRGDSRIRYIAIPAGRTLGAKRNLSVELSRGDLILHWDDDDWMAPHRIASQMEALKRERAEVSGLPRMLFYDAAARAAWLYDYPQTQRRWVAGGSLLYTKDFWKRGPFPDVQVASDTHFIWNRAHERVAYVEDFNIYVAMIHKSNTSPKSPTDSDYWKPWPAESVERVLGADLAFYRPGARPAPVAEKVGPPEYTILMAVSNAREMTQMATLRTLRHIAGQDARLLVIDNASNDGAGEWLDALQARGDIDLIRNRSNIGHGPALELARGATRSPYIVTIDSDAFPISDDWLRSLRARLDEGAKVAGILHHRDYIHPYVSQ
jgi:glycosyltransferase involved in cell wall biosynthesis